MQAHDIFLYSKNKQRRLLMNGYQYKVELYVNHRRTEVIVTASCYSYAKDIAKAQFAGSNVTIIKVTRL